MIENNRLAPICLGGFGDINFGKQYLQGNRVYDSRSVAMALNAIWADIVIYTW